MPGLDEEPETPVGESDRDSEQAEEMLEPEVLAARVFARGSIGPTLEALLEGCGSLTTRNLDASPRVWAAIDAFHGRQAGADMQTNARKDSARPQKVPLAYAGKWLAWSDDGLRILAVGESFEDCERIAVEAGHDPHWIAVSYVPKGRFREDEVGA